MLPIADFERWWAALLFGLMLLFLLLIASWLLRLHDLLSWIVIACHECGRAVPSGIDFLLAETAHAVWERALQGHSVYAVVGCLWETRGSPDWHLAPRARVVGKCDLANE
jgi:hypothetical protein